MCVRSANRSFDRSSIGITYWNVHVQYELAVQSANYSTDCIANCKSNIYIPVSHTNGRSIKSTIDVIVNRLVDMGL